MSQFQGKWALVTGASSGIGKVFALKLAAEGAKLVLVARNEETLKDLAETLKQAHNTETFIIIKDLRKPSAAQEIFSEVHNAGISVDILVNNAGFGTYGHLHEQDLERNLQMLMVNIYALTALTQLFLPDMVAKKSGIVINISSLAAFLPLINFTVYSATKAYVRYFSETLWAEYQKEGIRFLCVCPGSIDTNFHKIANMAPSQPPVDPEVVVDQALKALAKNKIFVVCGPFSNKILSQLTRLFSKKMLVKIVNAVGKGKD